MRLVAAHGMGSCQSEARHGPGLSRNEALSRAGEIRLHDDVKEGREEIVTPPAEPTDLELIRRIAATGGRKYTAGNIDRRKYQRLVALGWLTETSVNISDVLYEITDAGKAAAHRED